MPKELLRFQSKQIPSFEWIDSSAQILAVIPSKLGSTEAGRRDDFHVLQAVGGNRKRSLHPA